MTSTRRTSASTGLGELWAAMGLIVMLAVVALGPWLCLTMAAKIDGAPMPPKNPIATDVALWSTHTVHWTGTATAVAVIAGSTVTVLVSGIVWGLVSAGSRRVDIDSQIRFLARPRHLRKFLAKGVRAKATRLGVPGHLSPGLPLGRSLPGRKQLWTSWEDMLLLIAGPRTNKTTAYVIPMSLAAPGALIATSNKRDVLDATRGARAGVGSVYVLDPTDVAQEEPTWWWNPLSYVRDEVRAEKMASQLAASGDASGLDDYWDKAAKRLVGYLLLAAAIDDRPITQVYAWITRPTDLEPYRLLEAGGYHAQAADLYSLHALPPKQREGVYDPARGWLGFLRISSITRWITPPSDPTWREFVPEDFVQSSDTLYLLSREGIGSAGPVVAALTVAVLDAAEEHATRSAGGRMSVPLVVLLDEAANICRVDRLDSYYSFFGSMGIIIVTILQSWAQGEERWGQYGIKKLWSSSNVKVYGGTVDDDAFLRAVSTLTGPHDEVVTSESTHRDGRSRSRAVQQRTILTEADLRGMPAGRALVFASGTPAFLIEPQAWFKKKGDQHAIIESSIQNARDRQAVANAMRPVRRGPARPRQAGAPPVVVAEHDTTVPIPASEIGQPDRVAAWTIDAPTADGTLHDPLAADPETWRVEAER